MTFENSDEKFISLFSLLGTNILIIFYYNCLLLLIKFQRRVHTKKKNEF